MHAAFAETTEEQFDTLFNIHVKGVFFLTQQLLPLIAQGGRIVNVSSGLTRFALPGYAAYASMKGAVEVLTRYLAKELGERGIAVNTIAPGAIETDFGGGTVRDNANVNAFIASQTALGRVGLPDDIGGAIASLLSEHSRWVNAQRIEVSGGMFVLTAAGFLLPTTFDLLDVEGRVAEHFLVELAGQFHQRVVVDGHAGRESVRRRFPP